MITPLLLVADIIILALVYKQSKNTKEEPQLTFPIKEQKVSEDISPGNSSVPGHFFSALDRQAEKYDDRLIQDSFELWMELERKKNLDPDVEELLWREGLINPEETIWCDGSPLQAGYEEDLIAFGKIKEKALLEGMYNSKNLKEGGLFELRRDELRMKGASFDGAQALLAYGANPETFPNYVIL